MSSRYQAGGGLHPKNSLNPANTSHQPFTCVSCAHDFPGPEGKWPDRYALVNQVVLVVNGETWCSNCHSRLGETDKEGNPVKQRKKHDENRRRIRATKYVPVSQRKARESASAPAQLSSNSDTSAGPGLHSAQGCEHNIDPALLTESIFAPSLTIPRAGENLGGYARRGSLNGNIVESPTGYHIRKGDMPYFEDIQARSMAAEDVNLEKNSQQQCKDAPASAANDVDDDLDYLFE